MGNVLDTNVLNNKEIENVKVRKYFINFLK